ncbi:MAG: hypothetical protein JKY99_07940, partial [Rhizobiales bacterium]|nr:hypothetical protein [Hyphomicrobiales bacterium]
QGLMALEYTLFGKGSDALSGTGDDAAFRCQYAIAITQNIVVISAELAKYWSSDNAFSKRWLSPSATNPMVRDEIEQLSIVLKIFGDGVEIMKEQRFSPFLKDSQAAARPKAALFWRSNMSIPSLIGGIEMLDHLLANSKLDSLVTGNHKRELSAVRFEFANAKRALERAYANGETDMKTVLANEETYGQLNYAHIVLTGLVSNLRGPIPNMFGIITGFSSLDGD